MHDDHGSLVLESLGAQQVKLQAAVFGHTFEAQILLFILV